MKRKAIVLPLLVLILSLVLISQPRIKISAQQTPKDRARQLYVQLLNAEREGADVTEAAFKLNQALQLIEQAEAGIGEETALLQEAEALMDEVEASIPSLIEAGRAATQLKIATWTIAAISVVALSAAIYLYGPRLLWTLWLKSRGKWKVKKRG